MAIKAVIFDMDGVLIDAKHWHYEALNQALGLFGYKIDLHEHLTVYDGLPTKTKLKRLSIEKGLPPSLHNFINQMKQQYTMNLVYKNCRPTFHHEYALARLKSEGYRLAVASNSIRNTVVTMMSKSNLDRYLDFSLSNEDVERPKPDPEIYLTAINNLGLHPKECLIVEDNENGIRAAYASKANVMVVKKTSEVNYQNIRSHINNLTISIQNDEVIL